MDRLGKGLPSKTEKEEEEEQEEGFADSNGGGAETGAETFVLINPTDIQQAENPSRPK